MSGSVNKVILVGRVGKDPEVRRTNSGDKIVNLSVATSETWKDKTTGERKEKTEWSRVAIFDDRLADVAEKYVKKGAQIYLEGQLVTRKWQGNDGSDRYSTEVHLGRFKGVLTLLDSPRASSGGNDRDDGYTPPAGKDDLDSEIPF